MDRRTPGGNHAAGFCFSTTESKMKTIEVNLYQFDELNDRAKEKARNWYRHASAGDNFFSESIIEDATEIAKRLGITFKQRDSRPCVYWSGFSSQCDGASFEGSYCAPEGSAVDLVKAHAPRDKTLHAIAVRFDDLQKKYGNTLDANVEQRGRYYHAHTMHLECVEARDADSEAIEVSADDEQDLLETLRAFANWIYQQLESENEYRDSDEYVDEAIRANEYDFHADGSRSRI
jgi:hypothetical protein